MIKESMKAAALPAGSILGESAAEIIAKTLNSGSGGMMIFDSAFGKSQPGDTVRFVPADKDHNAKLIKWMALKGASTLRTVADKAKTVSFEKAGLYGFKCSPHDLRGIVGLIQVDDRPENLEAAKAVQHGKLAAKRVEPSFEQQR